MFALKKDFVCLMNVVIMTTLLCSEVFFFKNVECGISLKENGIASLNTSRNTCIGSTFL